MTEHSTEDVLAKVQANIEASRSGADVEEKEEQQEELFEVALDGDEDDEEADDGMEESEVDNTQQALDHGYLPYDEYIEKGGDPEMYRGPKAFNQYKEMRDKLRADADATKKELEELRKMFIADKKADAAKHKKALEKALAQAKEDMDVDRVYEISNEMHEIDTYEDEPEPDRKQTYNPPKSLVKLLNENPIIDNTSAEFDIDVTASLARRLDQRLKGDESEERVAAIIEQEWLNVQKKFGLVKDRQTRTPPKTPEARPGKKGAKRVVKLNAIQNNIYQNFIKNDPEAAAIYLKSVEENA